MPVSPRFSQYEMLRCFSVALHGEVAMFSSTAFVSDSSSSMSRWVRLGRVGISLSKAESVRLRFLDS